MSYFDGIKIGDKVWSSQFGWGKVRAISKDTQYFIDVLFADSAVVKDYNIDGKLSNIQLQTLFWNEFKIPEEAHKRPLQDKQLVWAWDTNIHITVRVLGFYDAKNKCLFCSVNGSREGSEYQNYTPYIDEYPEWAAQALKKLED